MAVQPFAMLSALQLVALGTAATTPRPPPHIVLLYVDLPHPYDSSNR